jgi:hypothetical protein
MPDENAKRLPQVSVQFRPEQLEELRAIAQETDTPVATLIRQWTLRQLQRVKAQRAGRVDTTEGDGIQEG